jgi:type VI secretion system protein ImpA
MSTIDIDAMLADISPQAPCGPNLEYDPVFQALEREALGKPEVQYGATITPAVPPDWKTVRRMAAELIDRSRDLRLAVYLTRANLALNGIAGFADGLTLIERLLDGRWASVNPPLDPDDKDPSQRINSLAILSETTTLVRELKDASLVPLPGLGPLTLRMLEIASGELAPPAGQEKIGIASIESAIADLDQGQLGAAVDALGRALAAVVNIEQILVRHVGSAQALNFDALARPLSKAHGFLASLRQGEVAAPADAAGPAARAPPSGESPARAPRSSAGGDIASRDDVLRALDQLVRYYQRNEPSSPVPILLERAKRLVPMNFFEIMRDLAPDGVAQLVVIRGPEASKREDES